MLPNAAAAYQPFAQRLQELKTVPTENRNAYIKLLSKCLEENTCPITLRKLIEAQHSYEGVKLNQPDRQSIRMKAFCAGTVGSLFAIATRVVRSVGRTCLLPVSLPIYAGKSSRLSITGIARDEWRETCDEWKDLVVSAACMPIGICKTFKPDAFTSRINKWQSYYVKRIDERNAREFFVKSQVELFAQNRKLIKAAWKNSSKPPVINAQNQNRLVPNASTTSPRRIRSSSATSSSS